MTEFSNELELTDELCCPHCKEYYDMTDSEVSHSIFVKASDLKTFKDSDFCETSASARMHYKCKKCGGYFYEDISWDN